MWGMTPTGQGDAARVLYGRTLQFGNFMPAVNQFGGLPLLLPGDFFPSPFSGTAASLFTTDGDTLRDSAGRRWRPLRN